MTTFVGKHSIIIYKPAKTLHKRTSTNYFKIWQLTPHQTRKRSIVEILEGKSITSKLLKVIKIIIMIANKIFQQWLGENVSKN